MKICISVVKLKQFLRVPSHSVAPLQYIHRDRSLQQKAAEHSLNNNHVHQMFRLVRLCVCVCVFFLVPRH